MRAFLLFSFLLSTCLGFTSCNEKNLGTIHQSSGSENNQEDISEEKPNEEDIKYFFIRMDYEISMWDIDTDDYYDSDSGWVYVPQDIEEEFNIVDSKRNVVDIMKMLKLVKILCDDEEDECMEEPAEHGECENHYKYGHECYYKTNTNIIEEHKQIAEDYTSKYKKYCTDFPKNEIEAPIFNDNIRIRLYDRNDKIIAESKVKGDVSAPKTYDGRTYLTGILKLPPKEQREGLKYRIVHLDENGNPKPYLFQGVKKPFIYYFLEGDIESYSRIQKYWNYVKNEESNECYHKPRRKSCNLLPSTRCILKY